MSHLYIVEKVTPDLLRQVLEENSQCHLLLMTPQSVAAFHDPSCFNLHYPEDFLNSGELSQMGIDNMALARQMMAAVDETLQQNYSEFQKKNLEFAFYHVDRLKIVLDSLLMRLRLLHEVIKQIKPLKIIYFDEPKIDVDITLVFRDSIFTRAVPLVADEYGISCATYSAKNPVRKKGSINRNNLKSLIRPLYIKLLSALDTVLQARFVFSKKKFRILSINASYDQNVILKNSGVLKKFEVWKWYGYDRGPTGSIICSPDSLSCKNNLKRRRIDKTEPAGMTIDVIPDGEYSKLCEQLALLCDYKGSNWFALIEDRIRFFVQYVVPQCYNLYLSASAYFSKLDPHVGIYNAGIKNAQEGAIIKALKEHGSEFAMVQHGGGGYGMIQVPAVDTRDFEQVPDSHYICWGEGVKEYFKKQSEKFRVSMMPAGSQIIKNIYKSREKTVNGRVKKVCYILNSFRNNFNYYPGGQHFTDTWYFRLHLKIFSIFKGHPNYDFVIKVPPNFGETDLYRQVTDNIENISIRTTKLTSIINEPDLYIIDSMSTTIIQTAATQIPIIIYTGEHCKTPNPSAVKELEKRAVCCATSDGFLNQIETCLKDPSGMRADPNNSDFINKYGMGRAAGFQEWDSILENIVNRKYVFEK